MTRRFPTLFILRLFDESKECIFSAWGRLSYTDNVRIVIRTNDHIPPHVHAIHGDAEAKIVLGSGEILKSRGFSRRDLERICIFVREQEELLLEAWNAIHKKDE